jgi:hypothetical protein
MRLRGVVPALAIGMTACASNAATPADQPTAPTLCKSAVPNGHLIGASLTDVQQVRRHTGGPGDVSPAAKPWQDVPSHQAAAWCTIRTTDGFVVGAATLGAPFAAFMRSDTNPGVFPDGPAIP